MNMWYMFFILFTVDLTYAKCSKKHFGINKIFRNGDWWQISVPKVFDVLDGYDFYVPYSLSNTMIRESADATHGELGI